MFLLDFVAFNPPKELLCNTPDIIEDVLEHWKGWGNNCKITLPESRDVLRRFQASTGIGRQAGPANLSPGTTPLSNSWACVEAEARMCTVTPTKQLLAKTCAWTGGLRNVCSEALCSSSPPPTGVALPTSCPGENMPLVEPGKTVTHVGATVRAGLSARDIDIVVTTSSTFHPVPSLASMLVNEFKMREDVKAVPLGNMACSAGAVAINIIADLMKANPNSNCLLVTHENVTQGFYTGGEPQMLVGNLLFGMNGAAVLFTNKRSLASKAKYQLLHSVRVHLGADDEAYTCMGTQVDSEGIARVGFTPKVTKEAAKAISKAMEKIAPKILNWSQLAAAVYNMAQQRIYGREAVPRYEPSFGDCMDHFLLHPGIHGMLKGFMKGLKLPVEKVLPSAAALRDFGNLSASSTFYVLAYLESLVGVKRGETVLQISVGTGVKAGVNVWQAVRAVQESHPVWEHQTEPVRECDLLLPLYTNKEGAEQMKHTAAAYSAVLGTKAAN